MVRLSIIVPIYNVEPFLRKCVDSLLVQDYEDYEIILVDDGSPDGCPAVCDQYAADYRHVRVVHQQNGGLSAARNSGVEVAKGEYILFADSDDYIEPNVLGALMAQVERERLDVLRFDYQNVRLKSDDMHKSPRAVEYEVYQPYRFPHSVDNRTDVVSGERYMAERMGYNCYAWQFLIKRELAVPFMRGIHFEDTEWLPRMMFAAKRVNSTSKVVYNYFRREGSITLTQGDAKKVRKNIEDILTVIERYNQYVTRHPDCSWLKQMRSNMAVSVLASVAQSLYPERKEYIRRLAAMKVFPLTTEVKQGKTYLRKARLVNISPRLAVELLHLKNRH